MSTRTDSGKNDPIIESRADLISVFAGGEKPKERWRIGTEHEKFVYRTSDHRAPSYEEPGGIRDLLAGLTRFPSHPAWKDSFFAPPLANTVLQLKPWLPAGLAQRLRYH